MTTLAEVRDALTPWESDDEGLTFRRCAVCRREFQSNYQRLDEPVVVMARSRTLGTWYPKGSEPLDDITLVLQKQVKDSEAEIKYLKSELAKRLTTKVESASPVETFAPTTAVRATIRNGSFGHSTPAPKP